MHAHNTRFSSSKSSSRLVSNEEVTALVDASTAAPNTRKNWDTAQNGLSDCLLRLKADLYDEWFEQFPDSLPDEHIPPTSGFRNHALDTVRS